MKELPTDRLGQFSMLELFRSEVENQAAQLSAGLLELERKGPEPQILDTLMRAAHSLKGAARIINLPSAVSLAHALEDCFVHTQTGQLDWRRSGVDPCLKAVDLLASLSRRAEAAIPAWETENAHEIEETLVSLRKLAPASEPTPLSPHPSSAAPSPAPAQAASTGTVVVKPAEVSSGARKTEASERVLRLTAENLNRLLGLAGESLVESRWLRPFADSLERLKNRHTDLAHQLENLRQALDAEGMSEGAKTHFNELFRHLAESRHFLNERLQELDQFDRRSAQLSHRLYLEVLRTRMRPFGDAVRRFPRMVRDLARSLGKQVRLEIAGESTPVDRDILERLESPLTHLLRNAVDHGCQTPEEREQAGKPPENVIRLEARHSAGMLLVSLSDDGAGVQPEMVRQVAVEKRLALPGVAHKMTNSDLLEFLFLPGFTLKNEVTEISGRGVGLDVVQNMVRSVRGAIRINNQPGSGLRVQLQLPLTLSVLRALLCEVAGEPYAIPLSQIARTLKLPRANVESLEGRHLFRLGDQSIGLITARELIDSGERALSAHDLPVVVLGDRNMRCGVVVDRFLGERELVVHPLDPRLGKVQDVSAAALLEDGSPVLILDVEDLLQSIASTFAQRPQPGLQGEALAPAPRQFKRVLAVDDSLTVRELMRRLLTARGYLADVAVNGQEAWNALRTVRYDLVITDIDMPQTSGKELVALIRNDPEFKSLPVLVVSYKDREEDRLRGLEAGADYYLAKSNFDDDVLLRAVTDLIGEAGL